MKKLYTTQEDLLRSLVLYWLFMNQNTRDAFALAQQMGIGQDDEELKAWLERGCKVHWAWIQGKGELSDLLMSQQTFGSLVTTQKDKHQAIKPVRDAASKRWSNVWKQLRPKIATAKTLSMANPTARVLELTWQTALSGCSLELLSVGRNQEANELLQLARM